MPEPQYVIQPIGHVESPLTDRDQAPNQPDEGAPEAWLVFDPAVREGLADLKAGEDVLLLTWLERADREVLAVHPRGDLEPGKRAPGKRGRRPGGRPTPCR